MKDLISIAMTLLDMGKTTPQIRPFITTAAREMLCLAEAEMRASKMAKIAEDIKVDNQDAMTLPELFDTLKNTNRDCREILRSIEKMDDTTPDEITSRSVGKIAIETLGNLATSIDDVGQYRIANSIDRFVAAIVNPKPSRTEG